MRIAVLCSDTFPLQLSSITKAIEKKCTFAGALGKRSYQIIRDITSASTNNTIDVYIPHYNFPPGEISGPYFYNNVVNYISYNFHRGVAFTNLIFGCYAKQKKKYDYIILPTSAGVNFEVVCLLSTKIGTKVIADNWVPFLQEQDINLVRYGSSGAKKYKKFKENYSALLQRADIILYDNTAQLNYLEGFLHALGFRESQKKLVRYVYDPFLAEDFSCIVEKKKKAKYPINLLWYGPLYPWYNINPLCCFIMRNKKFKLTMYGVRHPRYSNYYDKDVKLQLLEYSGNCSNITIIEDFIDKQEEERILTPQNVAIVLDNSGIESKYSVRVRVLDLLAKGIPVITNSALSDIHLPDGLYKIANTQDALAKILNSKIQFSSKSYASFFEQMQNDNILEVIN